MRKVISIIMSVLLLTSSSGIAYAQHFCGDFEMLSEITLGEKHLSCGMAMEAPGCEDSGTKDHKCCDNKYTKVNTDDSFAKASFSIDFPVTFVAVFVSVFVIQQIDDYPSHINFYAEYHPPPLEHDFQVLYETFLI
jgi:hypothetical protein